MSPATPQPGSTDPSKPATGASGTSRLKKVAPAIIVGSVMFSFISYWRVAAVVLCDMASTAFYIGGIVEQVIGPAAPWFIGAVMVFSFAMGLVYIESCALFVRGGVYRVVKEAIGSLPAKAAVSALLFDYILTGPISSVSAGQYLIGWLLDFIGIVNPALAIHDEVMRDSIRRAGSVVIAIAIVLYFFWKNLIGIHESTTNALRIMGFTTVVAVLVLVWSFVTLAVRGPANSIPMLPNLEKKVEYETEKGPDRVTGEELRHEKWKRDADGKLVVKRDEQGNPVPKIDSITGRQVDPLGFMPHVFPGVAEGLRQPTSWLSLIGVIGILVAFGHSVLAMSGEETMAQVYREVESPKLENFKKAAYLIFGYAFILTTSVSFLAVLLIPDEVRMKMYADNLLGGLAMYCLGPPALRLTLNALVVAAGFLILSGATNTSIIGSNGVLNRVAEDGVLPDRLQKPHPKYGTTYRILYLIVALQIFTIIASGGDMILLGEAYAFGVLWSFLFNGLSMFVLRFKNRTEREFRVPFNLSFGKFDLPVGLSCIVIILGVSAVSNLFTKELATISGLTFSTIFMMVFMITQRLSHGGQKHEHIEQFTQAETTDITAKSIGLTKTYRKLVAIRSPQNLHMLEKTLRDTDPETTDVVVMTAKTMPPESSLQANAELDRYDRKLMTAVIDHAEKVGKPIRPLVVPTNNPLFAVINTARSLSVQELIVGASNKFSAEEQLDQIALYWINLHDGHAAPLTVRVLSETLDVHYDIGGGVRIPTASDRQARSVGDLREAGVGVKKVLMVHDASARGSDVFENVLTMLDPEVVLDLAHVPSADITDTGSLATGSHIEFDRERAAKVGREVTIHVVNDAPTDSVLQLVKQHEYDLVIIPHGIAHRDGLFGGDWADQLRERISVPICFLSLPLIPREAQADPPSPAPPK